MLRAMLALGMLLLGPAALPGSLRWDAPPGCPGRAEVLARARAQSESGPPADAPAMTGAVRRGEDGRWWLDLEIYGPRSVSRRTMEGESCEALADAAALIIAMRWVASPGSTSPSGDARDDLPSVPPPVEIDEALVEPDLAGDEREGPVAPTVAPTPVEEILFEPEVEPRGPLAAADGSSSPAPALLPGWGGWLSVGGGVALGILPGAGGAVALEGGLEGRRWRAGLSGRGFPVRVQQHPQVQTVSGRFDLLTGGALGCGVLGGRPLAFPLCGRVEVGAVRGRGRGAVTQSQVRWSPWAGLVASAAVSWRALRFIAPFLAVEGVVGVVRPGFSVGTAPGTLYQMGRFGVRAWVGLELFLRKGPQKIARVGTQS